MSPIVKMLLKLALPAIKPIIDQELATLESKIPNSTVKQLVSLIIQDLESQVLSDIIK